MNKKNSAREKRYNVELMDIDKLREHPQNYRRHEDDQIEHIIYSLKTYGFYRNIVVSADNVILAGHGVVKAAKKIGIKKVPIIRVKYQSDDIQALKILTGDNEVSHLAIIDDRQLTELLKTIQEEDIDGLQGTGFDESMLANLVFITRPKEEINDFDAAAEWVGMPEYHEEKKVYRLYINFVTKDEREEFIEKMKLNEHGKIESKSKDERVLVMWYGRHEKNDIKAIMFDYDEEQEK